MTRPLISYCLLTYNQEEYVENALNSAFQQTYEPLEIVVHDDHSTDRTDQIVRRMLDGYRGPHRLRYRRAPKHIGLGGSVNALVEMAESDIVVIAAGDDMSVPERASEISVAMGNYGGSPLCIFSGYEMIDKGGHSKGVFGYASMSGQSGTTIELRGGLCSFIRRIRPAVYGCSNAWTKDLFSFYGPLRSDQEDLVLSFRALGIGKILYIDKPLVKYRRHGANLSFNLEHEGMPRFEEREKRLRMVNKWMVGVWDNIIHDTETLRLNGRIGRGDYDRTTNQARLEKWKYENENLMGSGRMRERVLAASDALRKAHVKEFAKGIARLMPIGLRRFEYNVRRMWFNMRRRNRSRC